MRTCTFLVVVAAMVYAVATPVTGCGESYGTTSIEGGWELIPNINDQHFQDLGRWAILEFLKHANCVLKFNKVLSGKEQVVSGMNYELIIDASDASGKLGTYKAEVYEQERTKTRKLVSFSKAN